MTVLCCFHLNLDWILLSPLLCLPQPLFRRTERKSGRQTETERLSAGSLSFLLKTSLTCMLQHLLQAALCLFQLLEHLQTLLYWVSVLGTHTQQDTQCNTHHEPPQHIHIHGDQLLRRHTQCQQSHMSTHKSISHVL